MLNEYLTNEKNDTFFTYDYIGSNGYNHNYLNQTLFFILSQLPKDDKTKQFFNIVEQYFDLHSTRFSDYTNLFYNVNFNLNKNTKPENPIIKNIKTSQTYQLNSSSYYILKTLKYIKPHDIKTLTENTTKIIKTTLKKSNLEKKLNNHKNNLIFLQNNREYFNNLIEQLDLHFSMTLVDNRNPYGIRTEKTFIDNIEKTFDTKNMLASFDKFMSEFEVVLNKLIDNESKVVEKFTDKMYVKKYTGSILDIAEYKKPQESFYITATDGKHKGFVGLKRVSHQQYSVCYRPVLVQNIENASLFNENTIFGSTHKLTLLDKVFILGDIKKVEPISGNISDIGQTCQALIDKSKIEKFLEETSFAKNLNIENNEEQLQPAKKKVNKL